ncbi:MAG: FAD-binding oxidoreductase, partial [Geobacteraceae bacterium]|nr:FAD-binding oxidoreductase [Geobacteraceae bacterium]
MQLDKAEILIVGAGIIGLTIARELVRAGHGDIVIIDKEPELGRHASGRN